MQHTDFARLCSNFECAYTLLSLLAFLERSMCGCFKCEHTLLIFCENILHISVVFDSIQLLFYGVSNLDHFTVLNYLFGYFIQKLLFGRRFELFGLQVIYSTYLASLEAVDVLYLCFVHNLHKYPIRIFGFQNVGKVAVEDVCQNLNRFFLLIRTEFIALYGYSVSKEPNREGFCFSYFMDPIFIFVNLSGRLALAVHIHVQLFDACCHSPNVYLGRKTVVVLWLI